DGGRALHVSLTPGQEGAVSFRVHSTGPGGEEVPHCQGTVVVQAAGAGQPPALDLAALRAAGRRRVDGDWCYEAFRRMGIDYGPAHRAIEAVYRGEDDVLVALRLGGQTADTGGYTLHPGLLDSALQATLALGLPADPDTPLPGGDDRESGGGSAELPFAVGEVTVTGAMTPVMWAHLRPADGGEANRVTKVDITLSDEAGRVAARLRDVAFTTYTFEDAPAPELEPAADRLLFAPRWQERALAPGGPDTAVDAWFVLVCDAAGNRLDGLAE